METVEPGFDQRWYKRSETAAAVKLDFQAIGMAKVYEPSQVRKDKSLEKFRA